MFSNKEISIKYTLQYEGGYTNHPADPGGPTNWGITIYDARLHWKPNATAQDVKDMPLSVAIDIYRKKYWDRMGCDDDPSGVDFATYDYGVNSGVGRAVPVRNRLKTGNAVNWVKAICAERIGFLHRLRTWPTFGKGWGRRVADVEAKAVRMAMSNTPKEVQTQVIKAEAKKATTERNKAATKTVATGGATQAPSVDPTGFDWTQVPKWGLYVGMGILAVFAIRYAYYTWIHNHRTKAFTAEAAA